MKEPYSWSLSSGGEVMYGLYISMIDEITSFPDVGKKGIGITSQS